MLLQNRNPFGHAFIKDIPGNAGDKPLQPTFPDKGGRLRPAHLAVWLPASNMTVSQADPTGSTTPWQQS